MSGCLSRRCWPTGSPNRGISSQPAFLALARAAAGRGAARNGVAAGRIAVAFPASGFGPTRVTVAVRGRPLVRVPGRRRPAGVPVRARATAELALEADGFGRAAQASGGGYDGPLAYRTGQPMRPDVALALDRLAAAAAARPASCFT